MEMWENSEYDIGDFYEFVSNPNQKEDSEDGAIQLASGPFEGMIYKYNNFKFTKPKTKDETPKVQYQFDVLHIPEEIMGIEYPDEMKESFERLLAEILIDIVMKRIEKNERVDYDNTDGESDIDESFERRVFYKLDNPVSEE